MKTSKFDNEPNGQSQCAGLGSPPKTGYSGRLNVARSVFMERGTHLHEVGSLNIINYRRRRRMPRRCVFLDIDVFYLDICIITMSKTTPCRQFPGVDFDMPLICRFRHQEETIAD